MTWIGCSAHPCGFNDPISAKRLTFGPVSWFGPVKAYIHARLAFSAVILGLRLTKSSWISVMGGIRISVGWKNMATPLAGGCILVVLIGATSSGGMGGKKNTLTPLQFNDYVYRSDRDQPKHRVAIGLGYDPRPFVIGLPLEMIVQSMITQLNSFSLLAVRFFHFSGQHHGGPAESRTGWWRWPSIVGWRRRTGP